jgi:general secretion pathway protein H
MQRLVIEILIVIVIIGITIGFALIAFGDFGASKRILFSAEQLANTLRLAQQQSILETNTMGLRIDNSSYQLVKFQNSSQWESPHNKGIYKIFYFPKNTIITLKTRNKIVQRGPQIIINSSGDMTPFTLVLGTSQEKPLVILTGSPNGTITLSTSHNQ